MVLLAVREDALMTVVVMSHSELSRFDTLMRVERSALQQPACRDCIWRRVLRAE
uniref:Uncharacterized protein n=1 Tax=Sphingomonas sp. NS2 TaxID=908605 RepID=A0A0D4ZY92_9SPHN|nr:hypothetical protein plasmid201_029 [Sphingomonas sp. NS2]